MTTAVYIKTTVMPGGRIEVSLPELVAGQQATVFVLLENEPSLPKRPLSEILSGYPGGQLFKTAAEVDAYIRQEREAWEG